MTNREIDRDKARAILAHMGQSEEYDPLGDYWIETTDEGEESLVTYGGDILATNRETTSWLSPGFPPIAE